MRKAGEMHAECENKKQIKQTKRNARQTVENS